VTRVVNSLTEGAAAALVLPGKTMRGQLDRLIVLAGLDNVDLAVVPFTTKLPFAAVHGFGSSTRNLF
jgi:hypothetical protein